MLLASNLRVALAVLVVSGCTQDFGSFRSGGGGVGGGSPCDCDDQNPCTDDSCDADNKCQHVAANGPLTQPLGDCKILSCEGTKLTSSADESDVPTDDGNMCTDEACDGDMPTHPFHPAGTVCNTDGVCNATGQCSDCDDAADCGVNTACATYECTANTCKTTYSPGTVVSGEDDNDCKAMQCVDLEPDPQLLPFPSDTEVDANACTTDTCSDAGEPVHDAVPAGTACDNGAFCDGADSCDGTDCVGTGGNPCAGGGECKNICDEAADSCNSPAGTACGSAATTACSSPDTCNGSGDCSPNNANNGSACNDGLFCNGADTCLTGNCNGHAGDPCPPLVLTDSNCNASCNENTDTCTANDPNGTGCRDGNPCTNGDTCSAGACIGGPNPCIGHNLPDNCEDSCNPINGNCTAADVFGTPCDEDNDDNFGSCNGNAMGNNCSGD